MVQRSPVLARFAKSLAPAEALGAVLLHLHRASGFPPGALPLIWSMIAFVFLLERRRGVRVLIEIDVSHIDACIRDERLMFGSLAKDMRRMAVQMFLDTCLELGLVIDAPAGSAS